MMSLRGWRLRSVIDKLHIARRTDVGCSNTDHIRGDTVVMKNKGALMGESSAPFENV